MPKADLPELETLIGVVRCLGEHAFALDDMEGSEIAEQFLGWTQHLLFLHPAPGLPKSEERRWADLLRFVRAHRAKEQQHVCRLGATMRDAVCGVLRTVDRALRAGRAADGAMQERLAHLRAVAEAGTADDLKREALATAEELALLISRRERSLLEESQHLADHLSSLDQQLSMVRREATIDPLTGLLNRRALDTELERAVAYNMVGGRTAVLVMIDVDHFKLVNDRFGHPGGDEILRRLANCLARSFPRRTDHVGRIGGEEFCVLLPDTRQHEVSKLVDRLLGSIRALRIELDRQMALVTVSVGYAELKRGEAKDAWVARADRALYAAKAEGRDRAVAAPSLG